MTDDEYNNHWQKLFTNPNYRPYDTSQTPNEKAGEVNGVIDSLDGDNVGLVGHSGSWAAFLQNEHLVEPHPQVQKLSRVGLAVVKEVLPPGSLTVHERSRAKRKYVIVELGVKGDTA
jgi:hypothetical protein